MVVKIEKATEHCETCFHYNQNKVEAGKASVLYMANIDDPNDPLATLERYERSSRRCQLPSFHMSINPSDTDSLTDEQMVEFVKELMAGLGYGDQPVILYKHNDIDRIHYHVVSVRVDANGKKINDSNEQRRCQALMKKLAKKYGFTIGKGEKQKEEELDDKAFTSKAGPQFLNPEAFEQWLKDNPPPEPVPEDAVFIEKVIVKKFNPKKGDYKLQIEQLVEQSLKYNFTNVEQFKALMKTFRVKVDFKRKGLNLYVTYAGINPKTGKPCTEPISDKKLKVPGSEDILSHMEKSQQNRNPEAKKRLLNALNIAMNHSDSEASMRKILAKMNISMTLTKNKKGRITEVTFVDHQTRSVFTDGQVKGFGAAEMERARVERWGENPPKDEKKTSPAAEVLEELLDGMEQQRDRSYIDDVYFRRRRRGPRRY